MDKFTPTEEQINTLFRKLRNNEPLTDEDKAVNAIINKSFEQDIREFVAIGQQPEYRKMVEEKLEEKDKKEVEQWLLCEREISKLNPNATKKEIELAEKNIRELSASLMQDGAIVDNINRELRKWKNYLRELVALDAANGANLPFAGVSQQGGAVIPQGHKRSREAEKYPACWDDLHTDRAKKMFDALVEGGILAPVEGRGMQEYTKANGIPQSEMYWLCDKIQDYLELTVAGVGRQWQCLIRLFGLPKTTPQNARSGSKRSQKIIEIFKNLKEGDKNTEHETN